MAHCCNWALLSTTALVFWTTWTPTTGTCLLHGEKRITSLWHSDKVKRVSGDTSKLNNPKKSSSECLGDSFMSLFMCAFDKCYLGQFSSVQSLIMSESLWPHGPQHSRPPCPSPTPGVYSDSCPLSRWCHPTISSSVVPFSSCLQSFPASGSFPMSRLFTSGGQSIGVSAATSILPVNIQDWSPLGWTYWISLQSKGLSRVT